MRGIQYAMVAGIIIILLMVGVSYLLVQPVAGFDFKKYFGLQAIIGEPGEIKLGAISTPKLGDCLDVVEHVVTTASQESQPSEVACSIASGIFNDFSTNGLTKSRSASKSDCSGFTNCIQQNFYTSGPIEQCLVDYKTFKLDDSKYDPTWEGKLSARECHVCAEGTTPVSVFDEVCINDNLKDRTVGSSNFCNGQISVGGSLITFGNAQCKNFNSATWGSHCDGWWCSIGLWCDSLGCYNSPCHYGSDTDDFCDNNEDRVKWIADDAGSDPAGLVKDNYYGDGEKNDLQVTKHQNYIYGLVWIPTETRYHLLFERYPVQTTDTTFNFVKTAFQNNYVRWNRLGNWRQEARMVTDVIVTPTVKKSVNELITDIVGGTGLGFSDISATYNCKGDCTTTSPKGPTEQCGLRLESASISSDYYFSKKPITFITSAEENGWLEAGKQYRVIITNWNGKYNKGGNTQDKDCFSYWDRTVIVTEYTATGVNSISVSANLPNINIGQTSTITATTNPSTSGVSITCSVPPGYGTISACTGSGSCTATYTAPATATTATITCSASGWTSGTATVTVVSGGGCTGILTPSITGSGTCSVTVGISAINCVGQSWELRENGNSVYSETADIVSYSYTYTGTAPSGVYTYTLYIGTVLKDTKTGGKDPTVSLSPPTYTNTSPNQAWSYTVSVKNNHIYACGSAVFSLSRSCPSGWTCSLNPSSLTIAAGGTASATITVTPPLSVTPGTYTFSVTATGGSYYGPASADYVVSSSGCTPNCAGRVCGPDPVCGQSCGTCTSGSCNSNGQCVSCTPNCAGRVCGPDPVCGQSCGTCSGGSLYCPTKCSSNKLYSATTITYTKTCDSSGQCSAVPTCTDSDYSLPSTCSYGCKDATSCFAGMFCDSTTAQCKVCSGGTCGDHSTSGGGGCYKEGSVPGILSSSDAVCNCWPYQHYARVVSDCSYCTQSQPTCNFGWFCGLEDTCGGDCQPGCWKANCYKTDCCTDGTNCH